MENNNNTTEVHQLLCFAPDLQWFKYHVHQHFNLMIGLGDTGVWSRFVCFDIYYDYILTGLRLYLHLSSQAIYASNGFRTESISKMKATCPNMCVPAYVLDMYREIARPMYLGNETHLRAFMPLTSIGFGIVPGLGFKHHFPQISSLMRSNFKNYTIVDVIEESTGISPAFISTDNSLAYSNGSTCPTFRVDSVNRLRFLRPHPELYLGYQRINQSNRSAPITFNPTQISNLELETPFPPGLRTYTNKIPVHGVRIFDVFGSDIELRDFSRGNINTISMVDNLMINNQLFMPQPIRIEFNYGSFSPDTVHQIVSAFAVTDEMLKDRNEIRQIFTFGTCTFRHDIVLNYTAFGSRFPSDANPSKEALSLNKISNTRKTKVKMKDKKKGIQEEERNVPDSIVET
jgi:hypothetical protein